MNPRIEAAEAYVQAIRTAESSASGARSDIPG